jgi:tRNA pseudouridine55 synthase
VRTLVEDIAARAGTLAHTANLHRESVGDFASGDMLEMGAIEAIAERGDAALRGRLLPPDAALDAMPALELDATNAAKFSAGQEILLPGASSTGLVRVYERGEIFRGVGELASDGCLAPRRVFHSPEKNS